MYHNSKGPFRELKKRESILCEAPTGDQTHPLIGNVMSPKKSSVFNVLPKCNPGTVQCPDVLKTCLSWDRPKRSLKKC